MATRFCRSTRSNPVSRELCSLTSFLLSRTRQSLTNCHLCSFFFEICTDIPQTFVLVPSPEETNCAEHIFLLPDLFPLHELCVVPGDGGELQVPVAVVGSHRDRNVHLVIGRELLRKVSQEADGENRVLEWKYKKLIFRPCS